MTDIGSLTKKPKKGGGKLAPPPAREAAPQNVSKPPREKKEPIRTLQFKLPESIFDDFAQAAGKEFGFNHGAKTKLFHMMFEAYKASKVG